MANIYFMSIEEFETKYREALDKINQRQTAKWLLAIPDATIIVVGSSMQQISLMLETFLTIKKQKI